MELEMARSCDVLVIGAGIAGIRAGAFCWPAGGTFSPAPASTPAPGGWA